MAPSALHAAVQPFVALRGARPGNDSPRACAYNGCSPDPDRDFRPQAPDALRAPRKCALDPRRAGPFPRSIREDDLCAGRDRAGALRRAAHRGIPARMGASRGDCRHLDRLCCRCPHPLRLAENARRHSGRDSHASCDRGWNLARDRGRGHLLRLLPEHSPRLQDAEVDVTAAEMETRSSRRIRQPVPALVAVLLATIVLAGLTLVLVQTSGWHGQGRPPAFEFLFLRDEPAAAWLSCLIILVAALASRAPRMPDRPFVAELANKPLPFIACVTVALAASAVLVYRGHALSMDEYAPLFQARIFARGRLMAEVPPELVGHLVPPVRWFIEASPDGRMLSAYWPGFALLLTPFAWAGAPWLLNPLIGGATLWMSWWIARRLWPDTAAGGWALLLTAASPAFVVNAISLYSMPAHLLASLCFTALLLDPTPRRLLCAGAVGSLALTLHHPLPHTLYAIPWLGALALRRGRLRSLATLAAGYLPGLVLLAAGWFWVRAQVGGNEETAARGLGAVASILGRLAFTMPSLHLLRSRAVNLSELAHWAVPGLLALACAGVWWRRAEPAVRLFAASALLTLAGYFFVPYDPGPGWGYRYFHASWGALPLLAACALEHPAA